MSAKKRPYHCDHDGREEIGDPYSGSLPDQIDSDTEDENVSHKGEITQSGISEDRFQNSGQGSDRSLEEGHRDRRKDTAFSHGSSHDADNDQIQDGFGKKNGIIACETILDGANDGHGADTDSQGGCNKAIYKMPIFGIAAFMLQPLSKPFDAAIQIDAFSDQGAQGYTQDHHHGASALQAVVLNRDHLFQGAGDTEKEDTDTIAFH